MFLQNQLDSYRLHEVQGLPYIALLAFLCVVNIGSYDYL